MRPRNTPAATRLLKTILLLDICCLTQNQVSSVNFPLTNVKISIPKTFKEHIPFFRVAAISDNSTGDETDLEYQIDSVKYIPRQRTGDRKQYKGIESFFEINNITGELALARPLTNVSGEASIEISIAVIADHLTSYAQVIVDVLDGSTQQDICNNTFSLCFPSAVIMLSINETTPPGTVLGYLRPLVAHHQCGNTILRHHYRAITENFVIGIGNPAGDLTLLRELDAEESTVEKAIIECKIETSDGNSAVHKAKVEISVQDADDNAPYAQTATSPFVDIDVTKDVLAGKELDKEVGVLDKDSAAANRMNIYVDNDSLNLFRAKKGAVFENTTDGATFISALIVAKKDVRFPGPWYNFTLVFDDVGYIGPPEERKVNFFIRLLNKSAVDYSNLNLPWKEIYFANISSSIGAYARVLQLLPVGAEYGFNFYIDSSSNGSKIFNITPKTGIVFLNDKRELEKANFTHHLLKIHINNRNETKITSLIVNVLDERKDRLCDKVSKPSYYKRLCSSEDKEKRCVSSCGLGATNGVCQWRGYHDHTAPNGNFATCTPDAKFCPDRQCDELEGMFGICPQDCATKVMGEAVAERGQPGIHLALGICSCSGPDSCTCLRENPELEKGSHALIANGDQRGNRPKVANRSMERASVLDAERQNQRKKGPAPPPLNSATHYITGITSTTACGQGCVAFIFLALTSCLVLFFALIFAHRFTKQKKQSSKHKYVGSRMSLSVIPSDYIVERSSSGVDSQTSPETSKSFDAKWEFPRDHLILEQTLGEGEFGKVMRAKAFGINGVQGYSTVAVKMLKGNGTIVEQQDLLSEFNMLKEVSHPNVIRLLGACTQKGGPLYVIVEYAEFGSLRSFLRKCRQIEFNCLGESNCCRENPNYVTSDNDPYRSPPQQVTHRDLLTFAWQIAKGMAYLNDMKLIHRDLAARNILLAAGKVIKISDFGLSRDVYEGDTYLKKSKGKVPVKWMAIESLEDHIYTTKSDVWSFGIVLWELVTLGATPYPGVTPERLFQLLKAGYRMEQPINCSNEFYNIMLQCWREAPHERPAFKELVQRFDLILQDAVQYLELDSSLNTNCPYWDESDKPPSLGEIEDELDAANDEDSRKYGNIHPIAEDDCETEFRPTNPGEDVRLLPLESETVVSEYGLTQSHPKQTRGNHLC